MNCQPKSKPRCHINCYMHNDEKVIDDKNVVFELFKMLKIGGYVGLGEIGPRGTWPKNIEKHCVTRWMRNENASSVASSATCLRDATAIGFASIAQCRSLESRFESGIGAISPSLTRALVNDDKMAPDAKRKMAPERDPSAAAVDLDDCRRSAPIVTPIVK